MSRKIGLFGFFIQSNPVFQMNLTHFGVGCKRNGPRLQGSYVAEIKALIGTVSMVPSDGYERYSHGLSAFAMGVYNPVGGCRVRQIRNFFQKNAFFVVFFGKEWYFDKVIDVMFYWIRLYLTEIAEKHRGLRERFSIWHGTRWERKSAALRFSSPSHTHV